MFTGVPQKHRQAAETYFDEHLSHNDYYTQDQTRHGQWIGLGAERLGLRPDAAVNREEFLRLCDNQHPLTGEQLTPQNFQNRRIYFDFVCSPPKSVSILAVTMNDPRIIDAHREASTIALRELESFAAARIRKDGIEDRDRVTGNLVGAAFLHTTSRALDPQLHTHFVLFNCTWDGREERWKALQTGGMFGALNYGTAVYRNELARRLQRLGYSIRRTGPSERTGSAFEVDGIDPKLIERFSKRSRQRDMVVKRQELKLGRKLTKKEVAHVVHQTRAKKLKGVSEAQVRRQQLGEIGFFEKRALAKVVTAANGIAKPFAEIVTESTALAHGLAHVFERQSVAPQHRILETALARGCGQLDLDGLKRRLADDANLVRVGSEFSTREILKRELYLIGSANAGIDAVEPFVRRYEPFCHLGPDQRKALAHVLTSTDQFTGFRGLAGSGKSTLLKTLAGVLRREGFEPVFCAPTASAADTLRNDGLEAVTLPKLIGTVGQRPALSTRSVIVLDEAGAVGLDDMARVFELARLRNCRMVLSGDTGQHASVARGDALRILEEYSAYRFSELSSIRRQKPEALRQVVQLAAAKQADKAFARLVQMGAVTEAPADGPDGPLYQRAADAYLAAIKRGKSALLVSPTWAEIDTVTETVRSALKMHGALGQNEQTFTVFDSLSWTQAQRKNLVQYEPGQRLRFVRRIKMFELGETVEVTGVTDTGLRVRRSNGAELDFAPATAAGSFDVGQARQLQVAAGDWLLLQANHGKEFINGERVQVRRLAGGAIVLSDGRVLPRAYNSFTHGYALTSHASQGKTVDEILLVASSRSSAAVSREQFYVSISRGRERIRVFTDDAELLARRVTESHQRKAAIELGALREELARLGFVRKEPTNRPAPEPRADQRPDVRTGPPRRLMRSTRLSRVPFVQRLAQMGEAITRQFGQPVTAESKEAVAEKIETTRTVTPSEKTQQSESVKPAEPIKPLPTLDSIRRQVAERRKLVRGIHPPGERGPSRSRGIGV